MGKMKELSYKQKWEECDKIADNICNRVNKRLLDIKTVRELEKVLEQECKKENITVDDYFYIEGYFGGIESYINDKGLKLN